MCRCAWRIVRDPKCVTHTTSGIGRTRPHGAFSHEHDCSRYGKCPGNPVPTCQMPVIRSATDGGSTADSACRRCRPRCRGITNHDGHEDGEDGEDGEDAGAGTEAISFAKATTAYRGNTGHRYPFPGPKLRSAREK